MLDPNFRHRLLTMIDEWISMGVDMLNHSFISHWQVLISTVNQRIYQNQLEN